MLIRIPVKWVSRAVVVGRERESFFKHTVYSVSSKHWRFVLHGEGPSEEFALLCVCHTSATNWQFVI